MMYLSLKKMCTVLKTNNCYVTTYRRRGWFYKGSLVDCNSGMTARAGVKIDERYFNMNVSSCILLG